MGDPPPVGLGVDIDRLDQVPAWLERLQLLLETTCNVHLDNIAKNLNTGGLDMADVDGKLNADATVFGGFYSAYGIKAKHDASHDLVKKSLGDMATALGKAADAARTIARNYRTTEEQNQANAAAIQRTLADAHYREVKPMAGTTHHPEYR